MRHFEKRQCKALAGELGNIHNEIVNNLKSADRSFPLLKACMEAAAAIAELIERSEGEGADAVKELEKYSDVVYSIYENISNGIPLNDHKVEKILRKSLRGVGNKIDELPSKTEIVFFPYKASMWDSLESVWRAADEDEDCDAYVVPIPYYDKNPDGSLGAFHYEGGQYPKDVPVSSYKDYDVEARHPNKIYIHNPYDEANFVTSVDPQFYSGRLRNMTDELVYIPYFVLGDVDPDNELSLEGMAHFVTVPGVINAHKVIVQSENMRKAYINVLTKNYGRKRLWEEKIIGSGSPKFDRVNNLRSEDYELPEEWQGIVNKPDGTRKKIIFYNTGLSTFLASNDKMLTKIRDVLSVFKKNRADIALLWRPHPLIEATLTSMRPQLWNAYVSIVETYKYEEWGIFDESAELERAIALSDAYYGDPSSVVQLYQKTGKPIMIENVEILND